MSSYELFVSKTESKRNSFVPIYSLANSGVVVIQVLWLPSLNSFPTIGLTLTATFTVQLVSFVSEKKPWGLGSVNVY
jgi:hypothetical protein